MITFRFVWTISIATLVAALLSGCARSDPASGADAKGSVTVSHIQVEAMEQPIGVDVVKPRFSWHLESQRRGVMQTAYEVQVGSHPGGNDLWSSGKVPTDRPWSEYAGPALSSRTRYWWRVRAYDELGNATPWHEPRWFETAFMDTKEWTADWIAAGGAWRAPATCIVNVLPVNRSCQRPAPLLRHSFQLREKPKSARLYAATAGYGIYSLNGARVTEAVLDPARSRLSKRVRYTTHDVTELLRPGENALGVELGQGFYGVLLVDIYLTPKPQPRMSLELHIEYEDGSRQVVRSDAKSAWRSIEGPTTYQDPHYGETYDGRIATALRGWNKPGFDDSAWVPAKSIESPGGGLSSQMLRPVRVTEERRFSSIRESRPGVYVLTADQSVAGMVEVLVRNAKPGSDITIGYSDKLDDSGEPLLNPEPLSVLRGQMSSQWDHFLTAGAGDESWTSRFSYKGFQYIRVSGWPHPEGPSIEDFRIKVVHTDFPATSTWSSSNDLLNRLWLNARWAVRQNSISVPTDGAVAEKAGWTGDANIMAATTAYLFDTRRYHSKYMEDIADCQAENGSIPNQVPSEDEALVPSPGWDNALFELPRVLELWYDDDREIRRYYPAMKRYLDWVRSRWVGADHLSRSPDFGDWADPNMPFGNCERHACQISNIEDSLFFLPRPLHSTAYWYRWLDLMARYARTLELHDDALAYEAEAAAVYEAFNKAFWREGRGVYVDGMGVDALDEAMYFNIVALAHGLVPPSRKERVVGSLAGQIAAQGQHLNVGIIGGRHALPMLSGNGEHDLAYLLATQTTYPSWGYWVAQGATSLWEYWEVGARSYMHQMHGSYAQWYYETLAGIRPSKAGFAEIEFRPHPAPGLKWTKATYESVRGTVESDWRTNQDGALELNISVPPNSVGLVYIPTISPDQVVERGLRPTQARLAHGVHFLRMEDGVAVFKVGSGRYRFLSKEAGLPLAIP